MSLISIAPMMDWTDRHDRYFLRLISKSVKLYTEMITAHAIRHGHKEKLLRYHAAEHPIVLQLGGSDTLMLSEAAMISEGYGYDEINLNVGCPSPRVSSGNFGACLMLEADLVAACISAMKDKVNIPVTIKCRIGVDDHDSYEFLCDFIRKTHAAGCDTFIIHARKAWLKGLSPKQNREIPPLRYDVVQALKKDFPHLTIIVNGGINDVAAIHSHLTYADGVMIGRSAYKEPYLLAEIEKQFGDGSAIRTREEVIEDFLPYVAAELKMGTSLSAMTRHILGLFQGERGAAVWRRYLSEHVHLNHADEKVILAALAAVKGV